MPKVIGWKENKAGVPIAQYATVKGRTYKQFLKQVDYILLGKTGLDHQDLGDAMWMDEWEQGSSPATAVRNQKKNWGLC